MLVHTMIFPFVFLVFDLPISNGILLKLSSEYECHWMFNCEVDLLHKIKNQNMKHSKNIFLIENDEDEKQVQSL